MYQPTKFCDLLIKGDGKIYCWIDILENSGLSKVDEKDFIPLQYTGLKDKSGKEIYEGDIVREDLENTGRDNERRYKIVWSGMGLTFENWEGEYITSDDFEQSEVIGNIYENPELLKSYEKK